MKNYFSPIPAIMLFLILVFLIACSLVPASLDIQGVKPSTLYLVIAAILAIYEIIVRLIPNISDISIISWIIRFLKWLSDNLSRNHMIIILVSTSIFFQ
jgi:UDP-N-acetylglucosamine enolpyruvyl transferase